MCIMLDSVTSNLRVVMNGETIFLTEMKTDLITLDEKLSIMGLLKPSGYKSSFFWSYDRREHVESQPEGGTSGGLDPVWEERGRRFGGLEDCHMGGQGAARGAS